MRKYIDGKVIVSSIVASVLTAAVVMPLVLMAGAKLGIRVTL